jgi:hypothetical protein
MNAMLEDAQLQNEANVLLGMPGNDLDLLAHKYDHYTERLESLRASKAPSVVVESFKRLQRKFGIALTLRRNSLEMTAAQAQANLHA